MVSLRSAAAAAGVADVRRGLGEVTASQADESAWYDVWGKLKQLGAQIDQAVVSLQANASYAMSRPNLAPVFQQKLADVESMRSKATWLRDTIRKAMSAFGVELSGLGIVPVAAAVLWPVAVAGVSWLGTKALDLWKFSQLVDEQRRLEEGGMSPQAAAALVASKADAGTIGGALKAAGPVLIGAGVIGIGVWLWLNHRPKGRRR